MDKNKELEVTFGFHKGYWPTYIFVGGEDDNSLWYTLGAESVQQPIEYPAITGYIRDVRVSKKEYKGKPVFKLDIKLDTTSEIFKIRSGIGTTFSKGVISNLSVIDFFEAPLTIVVSKGDDDKVVFGNVWNPISKTPVKSEYITDSLFPAIQKIQEKLGVSVQTAEDFK